jgi:hypothetical protein
MTERVCPNCGCGLFKVTQSLVREVTVDGDRNTMTVHEPFSTHSGKDMTCVDCTQVYKEEALIDDEDFHEAAAQI